MITCEIMVFYSHQKDGYYLLLNDTHRKALPKDQLREDIYDNSWALHCAHIRQGRCILLQGPDPANIYPDVSWPELESALTGELNFVASHLDEYPAYCVLNLCRLIYSYSTRDVVVSKRFSAQWAAGEYPVWAALIESAKNSYDHLAGLSDDRLLDKETGAFFAFALDRIELAKKSKISSNK